MNRKVAAAVFAALLGTGSSLLAADRPAERPECEENACFLSSGNCDLTDIGVACKEILEEPGCKSYNCPIE
jgi:hypothetical protein